MQGGDRPSAFGNSRVGRRDGWSPVPRHHRIPLIDRLPVTDRLPVASSREPPPALKSRYHSRVIVSVRYSPLLIRF